MTFHYDIIFLDKSKEHPTKLEKENLNKQTESLKFNRGNLLDYIIEMEAITNILIEDAMMHKRSKLGKVFRTNILNNRNVTFKNKIDLLCVITKEKEELDKSDSKLLYKSLNSLREERNKWAHGRIYFKEENKDNLISFQPYLSWINSEGKKNELIIKFPYFGVIVDSLETAQEILLKILKKRKILPNDISF